MPSTLLSLFRQLPDPRRDQGKMYPLAPILLFTVLAMLAGAVLSSGSRVHPDPSGPAERRVWFVSAPRARHSSVRFILRGLNAEEMERAFRDHAACLDAACLAEAPVEGARPPMAVGTRHSSSRKIMSSTPCKLFSTAQWLRMIGPSFSAGKLRELI